ncbi:MAG: hypothetical protein NUV80_02330 [Candidatus Berkelbacteria bacterium]|nr:hypothetical protein [Candidatus Berkelbacteria bacterium]
MPTNEILQLGAVAVIFLFAVKEFFGYLKSRKDSNNVVAGSDMSSLILKELQTMNTNHLHTLQETIEQGNARLVDSMHNDNTKIIELLGEIKGHLSSRR